MGQKASSSSVGELEEAARDMEYLTPEPPPPDPFAELKNSFKWLMVTDVFLIVFLFTWLIIGTVQQYIFGNTFLVVEFMKYWDPYFSSVLSVFMGIRLTSIAWGALKGDKERDDRFLN